jgi:hypothetical protein
MRTHVALLTALATALLTVSPADATIHNGHCARIDRLHVPGAQLQVAACLDELTTAGTVASGHTVAADWAGLTSASLPQLTGAPGIQLDGYFPDTSTTNTNHGWNHDAQFVLRLPDVWNGGLIVSGTPGNRRQYANDRAIADYALTHGYAFAATDKGNTGLGFAEDGLRPGDAILEWHTRVTQLAIAARAVVAQRYGHTPTHTLMAGISNGGYLVRWQLERNPWLFDGGVDWEGTLWTPNGPNLLTFLPPALRAFSSGDHAAMLTAGFAPGSEFMWPFHNQVYWTLTQTLYQQELDPAYIGAPAAYDYITRPAEVHQAVARISLTGRIAKPLITLHGTLDSLLPISQSSDAYAQMIRVAHRDPLFRYYRIENGNHIDSLVDTYPTQLRPIAPCFQSALDVLSEWLRGHSPGPSAASQCGRL